jgi:hypothetical protein
MKTKLFVLGVALVAVFALSAQAGQQDTMMAEFPEAGVYVLHSEPQFSVNVGEQTELVTCKAKLVLRTGEAYVTADGKRRVDLEVVSWQADGYSELMGGDLHFRKLADMTTDDTSYVESYALHSGETRDFPAHAQFAVPYELETPFGTVSGLYGLTQGTIEAFPPQPGALFKMVKGDTANVMAALMPEPVSALSAAGDVTAVNVSIEPLACLDVDPN